jgi:putative ABC transport system permease protein
VAALVAQLLAPAFPLPVTIETSAYLVLPAIAVIIGSLASLAALRRAVSVDPAIAFAG